MATQMPRKRDAESGKYVEQYSPADLLEAIHAEGGLAGTSDIADRVDCRRETAYKKLKQMQEDGLVQSRKVGRSLVWRPADS